MKLYTENQVRQMLFDLGDVLFNNCQNGIGEEEPETYFDGIIESQTPIELPSDEGIKKIMELDDMEFDEFDPYHVSHLDGAKWMRDKIQGGNK